MLTITLIINSCIKQQQTEPNSTRQVHSLSRTYNDMPSVENGRLKFTDSSHFAGYLEYLSEEIVDDDSSGTGTHDKLEIIENSIPFTSLRHISKAIWDTAALTGWNSFEEIPEEHFIRSILIRSVLNSTADVQIGDKVFHFVNAEYAISLPETAVAALDSAHLLTVTSTETDIDVIVSGHANRDIIFLQKRSVEFWEAKPTGGSGIVILKNVIIDNSCTQPNIARLTEFYLADILNISTIYNANFIISWGDGSPDQVVLNMKTVKNITHTYPGPGHYNITIAATSTSSSVVGAGFGHIDIGDCIDASNEFETHWAVDGNPNYVIRGCCWMQQFKKFGADKITTGASTKAFWKNSAGKWKPWLAYAVYVNYSVQKHKTDCSGSWNGSGGDFKKSKTEVITEYTQGGHVSWDPMVSTHAIYINGPNDYRVYNQTMDYCN